jgi:NAD(P)-dependent dehydrogenase (short-subunit alcohol dehydrogenase family)
MNAQVHNAIATEPPIWFITGCSTGFGLELARQAIDHGYRTVVTSRNPAALEGFGAIDNVLVLTLDVTRQDQVVAAVKAAQDRFGGIDVLVNNAGIGYFAAIEEGEEAQVRKMFDVNVFGLTRMIQAVLPDMRKRRRGCIVNLSSLAGIRGMSALGQYCATKFAVEGLSEALRQEVAELGLQVMVVEPSGFRTDWAGRSANESKHQIDDYIATAGNVRRQIRASSGQQPGDPVRAVNALIDAVVSGHPPDHLLLGNDAFDGAMTKVHELRTEFAAGEAVARAADFPQPAHATALGAGV